MLLVAIGDRCHGDNDCRLLKNSKCIVDKTKNLKRCTCDPGFITHLLPSGLKDCNKGY